MVPPRLTRAPEAYPEGAAAEDNSKADGPKTAQGVRDVTRHELQDAGTDPNYYEDHPKDRLPGPPTC